MRALLLLPLLLIPAWSAQAAPAAADKEATYEIEVLVIENRLPELVGEELLGRDPVSMQVRGLENTAVPEAATGQPYLKAVIAPALERDGRYRILAHAHWQQTVDAGPKPSAKPVRIAAGTPTNPTELDGTIRFSMSRYLHLDVNLLFRPQAAEGTAAEAYRISEQRRVKSQETQYFDHPQFGVLVRVMPADKPEKDKKP
jgi:hypothetical protein